MRKSVTPIPNFFSVCRMWVSLNKRLVNNLYPKFFPVNMIFLEEQSLGYNKICMEFNPRRGARGPLSAPRLTKWAIEWQLPISCTKCCFMTIGASKETSPQSYVINTCNLQHVVQVSDLGVTVDSRLKFSTHISNICCKAHKRPNLIIRCFHSKYVSSLITAFKVYVRPILEYCSVVWNPFLIKDINTIEAVQRMFTKRLPGMKHLTYHQRLVKLELESLELRRVLTDLLCVYKIIFGLVDVCLSDFFCVAV